MILLFGGILGGFGIVLLELRVLCDVGRVLLVLVVFGSCFGNGDDVEGMQGVDGRSAGMLRGRRGVRATSDR